jgi:SAM-dependent methyltransferase
MPGNEADVRSHYKIDGLTARIQLALRDVGVDPDHPRPEDLRPVDEFHVGGAKATEALLDGIEPGAQTRVLDLGCGIGGTARFIAWRYGARVVGVDLTPEFVETAQQLSALSGLAGMTRFEEGSVLDLPFERASFEMIIMLHVGMNIPDKPALFHEVNRVLSPGGRFVIYDQMIREGGAVAYPMPWASTSEASYLADPETYRAAGRSERLALTRQVDRFEEAVGYINARAAAARKSAPPALGTQLIMGENAGQKIRNLGDAILAGHIGPWEMVFEKFG